MLDSTTRLLPLCFLSAGLSAGSSTALRAYLTVPAWQRSYTPMSVPKVRKLLYSLEFVWRKQGGAERTGVGGWIDNLAHGSCLRPVDPEMRRKVQDCRVIMFSFQILSLWVKKKKHLNVPQGKQNTFHVQWNISRTIGRIGHWIWCRHSWSPDDQFQWLWGSSDSEEI